MTDQTDEQSVGPTERDFELAMGLLSRIGPATSANGIAPLDHIMETIKTARREAAERERRRIRESVGMTIATTKTVKVADFVGELSDAIGDINAPSDQSGG